MKYNTNIQIERREKEVGYNTIHTYKKREEKKKKDKTQYTHTKLEMIKRSRIKHNTHIRGERREKKEG